MLTGKLPYDGDGVDAARANLLHATPPMGTRVPTVTVDPLLEAFTRRLMEKMGELMGRLEEDYRTKSPREKGN